MFDLRRQVRESLLSRGTHSQRSQGREEVQQEETQDDQNHQKRHQCWNQDDLRKETFLNIIL